MDTNPSGYYGLKAKLAIVKSVCKFVDPEKCDPQDDSVCSSGRPCAGVPSLSG